MPGDSTVVLPAGSMRLPTKVELTSLAHPLDVASLMAITLGIAHDQQPYR
jgi:hypothetical protein